MKPIQPARFYPDILPAFALEPLSDKFTIHYYNPNLGEGIVSLQKVPAGANIFGFTGFLTTEITQYSLQIRSGIHLHDPYFTGKILHSCAPNAMCDMDKRVCTALKDIAPMDPITIDYAHTEDKLFKQFQCNCGAPGCRGLITGRAE